MNAPLRLGLACTLALCASAQAGDSIRLDTPVAGWRQQRGEGAGFTQTVNYPASSVNTPESQGDTARIRGAIEGTPKNPALLVVNGVAMPLRVEEDGSFDRPYLFPAGSNSVEVRNADRDASRRVQFHATTAGSPAAKLRVLLAWDSDGTDLDLHVVTPDGQHAWYGDRVLSNGGAIDVDVTSGYGPEIFATPTPLPGRYLVYVNYFGGGYSYDEEGVSEAGQDLTTATLTIVSNEGSASEKQETRIVPMRAVGELTLVAEFSYP